LTPRNVRCLLETKKKRRRDIFTFATINPSSKNSSYEDWGPKTLNTRPFDTSL
jgi:hypothetical protein